MKKVLKNAIFILVLMFSATLAWGQIGFTKTQIAEKMGWDYTSGIATDSKLPYIYYEKQEYSVTTGKYYTSLTAFYFNENGYSEMKKILEPIVEINAWIKDLNKKFVLVGEMRWKDYSNGLVYKVEADENIVSIISYWEEN